VRDYNKLLRYLGLHTLCVMCRGRAERANLCRGCRRELPRMGAACARCAAAMTVGATPLCGACQVRPPPWDAAISAFHYEFPLDGLMRALKYRGRLAVARALGDACAVEFAPRIVRRPDLIAPVPLHWRRYLVRGFNQSLELARPVAAALDLALVPTLMRRTRCTAEQARLASSQRRSNVRGAFRVGAELRGMTVAIFDDVMTTGATLASAATVARRSGAREVQVWVCARA
jgi:ComF family protein